MNATRTVAYALWCVIFLGACVPVWNNAGSSRALRMLDHTKQLLSPFPKDRHIEITDAAVGRALVESRKRPAGIATGSNVLSLEQCRSLAIANSIEMEESFLEEAAQFALKNANLAKMGPHVFYSGEVSLRDNESYSYGKVMGRPDVPPTFSSSGGVGVNQYSTSRERSTARHSVEARWSPTDAGLAFYLAAGSRNDVLKQKHIRARLGQRIVGMVDAAFHRLLAMQCAIPKAEQALSQRQHVAGRLEELLKAGLASAEDAQKSRQKLIKARRLATALSNEAEQQRNILASLIHVSPEWCTGGFCVHGPLVGPDYCPDLCELELTALRRRPESYKAGLDHINTVYDIRRTIIKFFPRVTFFWRHTRDNDKHLYNMDWRETGFLVYFDLLDWWVNLEENKATRHNARKTDREIAAVALGITSQVRAAGLKYLDALDQLKATQASVESTRRGLAVLRERASEQALQKLLLIESEADAVSEEIDNIRAMGEAQALLAELTAACGTNFPH